MAIVLVFYLLKGAVRELRELADNVLNDHVVCVEELLGLQ